MKRLLPLFVLFGFAGALAAQTPDGGCHGPWPLQAPTCSGTVTLQPTTPGTTQTGNIHVSGKIIAEGGFSSSEGGEVALQSSTPGTTDTGNFNISGTGIIGTAIGIGLPDITSYMGSRLVILPDTFGDTVRVLHEDNSDGFIVYADGSIEANVDSASDGLTLNYGGTGAAMSITGTNGQITVGKTDGSALPILSLNNNSHADGSVVSRLCLSDTNTALTLSNACIAFVPQAGAAGDLYAYWGGTDNDTPGTEGWGLIGATGLFRVGGDTGQDPTAFKFTVEGASYLDGATTINSGLTMGGNIDLGGSYTVTNFGDNIDFGGSYTIVGIGDDIDFDRNGGILNATELSVIDNTGTVSIKANGAGGFQVYLGAELGLQQKITGEVGTLGSADDGIALVLNNIPDSALQVLWLEANDPAQTAPTLKITHENAPATPDFVSFNDGTDTPIAHITNDGSLGTSGKLAVGSTSIGSHQLDVTGDAAFTGPITASNFAGILSGTTGSIGGGALTAGTCATGTAAVSGAAVGDPVAVSASDGTLPNALATLAAAVTATDVVSVQVCAIALVTPASKTYNVKVVK